jgi:hypothetical protein
VAAVSYSAGIEHQFGIFLLIGCERHGDLLPVLIHAKMREPAPINTVMPRVYSPAVSIKDLVILSSQRCYYSIATLPPANRAEKHSGVHHRGCGPARAWSRGSWRKLAGHAAQVFLSAAELDGCRFSSVRCPPPIGVKRHHGLGDAAVEHNARRFGIEIDVNSDITLVFPACTPPAIMVSHAHVIHNARFAADGHGELVMGPRVIQSMGSLASMMVRTIEINGMFLFLPFFRSGKG